MSPEGLAATLENTCEKAELGDAEGDADVAAADPLHAPLLPAAPALGPKIAAEARSLALLGWPLVAEEVASYASITVSMMFVGRLGSFPLACASLAWSVLNITGAAYLVGVTSPVDTHVSTVHGARRFHLAGETLQRAVLFTAAAAIPVVALWWQVEPLLLRIGQQPALAAHAARYLRLLSPWLFTHGAALCLYRGLIAQEAVLHVLACSTLVFVATPLINWLLIFKLGLGLDGAALSVLSADTLYLTLLMAFTWLHNSRGAVAALERPWGRGLSLAAFNGWPNYGKLAAASTAQVMLDFAVYDLAVLLAGMLPGAEVGLAAMGIASQVNSLAFVLSFGMGLAAAARVGNVLGAGLPAAAKLAAEVAAGMGSAAMAPVAFALIVAGGGTASLFSRDEAVRREYAALALPMALALAPPNAVLSGVLRGCGRQRFGAGVNLASNWLVGLPVQLLLAFKFGWGVSGLWWGLALMTAVQAAALAGLVASFDWGGEARRAERLLRRISGRGQAAEEPLEGPA